jgi:hypothetical protein
MPLVGPSPGRGFNRQQALAAASQMSAGNHGRETTRRAGDKQRQALRKIARDAADSSQRPMRYPG